MYQLSCQIKVAISTADFCKVNQGYGEDKEFEKKKKKESDITTENIWFYSFQMVVVTQSSTSHLVSEVKNTPKYTYQL